jgi:hypothetical protein
MSEHDEQAALFIWAALQETRLPELRLLFAIPNGGARAKATAALLKAEGVKRGVPDVLLPVARLGKHGLWLELKVRGGRVSPEQQAWHADLRAQGYQVEVCWSWLEAAQEIETYLTWQP